MSLATATSSPSFPTSGTPRPAVAGGWVAGWRRALQRRRHADAQQAHDREHRTDAYIDRHGTVQLDGRSVTAFMQR